MTQSSQGIVLALTVHDPDRRLFDLTKRHLGALTSLYDGALALCSHATHPDTIGLLGDHGVIIRYQEVQGVDIGSLGAVRLATIAEAARLGYSHCHLCDHDRVLHWLMYFPDELERAIDRIRDHDFLIFGRTERAFATHPAAQRDTEALVTHAFELAWGDPWDITAGSRGLSQRAIRYLLAYSREASVGNDGEWPLVLRRVAEMRIGYMATEGLEFETTDRYDDQIAALGSRAVWIDAHYNTLASWEARIRTAHLIISAIRRASDPEYVSIYA